MKQAHLEQGPACRTLSADGLSPKRQVYTITEAAQMLGIGRSLAYELAKAGDLPGARQVGHRYVVLRSVLDAWLRGEAA